MPERRFDTGYWNDPDIMKLPMKAKLLYIYLWTNRHCNQAGLYEIALETIHFETKLDVEEIEDLLQLLKEKVAWLPAQNLMWVKNFLHRQSQSPKFLAAAAKCLLTVRANNGLVKEYLDYNAQYTLSIPYSYPIDRVSIPPYAYAISNALSDSFSLFGSFSLFCDRLRKAAAGSVDRLTEHERLKQELAEMGRERGYKIQSEKVIKGGRIDLCWIDSDDKLVAAFEVDFGQPRHKSLAKLAGVQCPSRYIILRTADVPYQQEEGIHVVGLGVTEPGAEDITSAKATKRQSAGQLGKKGGSVMNEVFADMRAFLGYPQKVTQDPIPSYGKEGQAIKRMLARGFTREAIMECWKSKVSQRGGEFVSMTWVNEDIGKPQARTATRRRLSTDDEIAASIKEASTWHGDS
jgi:hypothetical protein